MTLKQLKEKQAKLKEMEGRVLTRYEEEVKYLLRKEIEAAERNMDRIRTLKRKQSQKLRKAGVIKSDAMQRCERIYTPKSY